GYPVRGGDSPAAVAGVNGEGVACLLVDLDVAGDVVVAVDGRDRPIGETPVGGLLDDEHVAVRLRIGQAERRQRDGGDVVVQVDDGAVGGGPGRILVDAEPLPIDGGCERRGRVAGPG